MKRIVLAVFGVMVLLSLGCAPAEYSQLSGNQVYCKTHAREATFRGSPDEQHLYLDCLHETGIHEVEVKPAE